MNLEQLRASLREKHGALEALHAKAFLDTATDDDVAAYEGGVKECEALLGKIELAERGEALKAKASLPATAPAGSAAQAKVPAQAKQAEPSKALALTAAAVIKGKVTDKNPLALLDDEGYGQLAMQLKAVNTLVSAEGGVLVPAAVIGGGLLPLLGPESTFLNAGPRRVPLTNGRFTQGRGATGATAGYVAEGALKPVGTPTFDAISMLAKKLAGIVPLTNEARMWTIGNIEAYVQQLLRIKLAQVLDLNAWLGTGAGASPTGIFNKTGVQTVTPTFASATAPTLAELDAMATGFILALTNNFLYANANWKWVMSYRTAMRLADIRTTNGPLAFPEMTPGAGGARMWKGFPVVVSSNLPTNGGATTDETTIALVDFTHVLYGEEEGITIRMTEEATLDLNGAGSLLHLWQANMFAILAESMHDFGLEYAKAVAKATIRF